MIARSTPTHQGEGRTESYHEQGTHWYIEVGDPTNANPALFSSKTSWGSPYARLIFRDMHIQLCYGYIDLSFVLVTLENVDLFHGGLSTTMPFAFYAGGSGSPATTLAWKDVSLTVNVPLVNTTGFYLHYHTLVVNSFSCNLQVRENYSYTIIHMWATQQYTFVEFNVFEGGANNGECNFFYGHGDLILIGGRIGESATDETTAFNQDGSSNNLNVLVLGSNIGTKYEKGGDYTDKINIQGWETQDSDEGFPLRIVQSGNNVPITQTTTSQAISLEITEMDTSYGVIITPNWDTNVWVTDKTTSQFTAHYATSPASAFIDWFVYRN